MPAVEVIRAVQSDIGDLINLAKLFHGETKDAEPIAYPLLLSGFGHAVDDGMAFIARDEDGDAIGALVVHEQRARWWSDARCVRDLMFYVTKGARGGPAAVKLIRAAATVAGAMALPLEIAPSANDPERGGPFFQRLGFKVRAILYRLEQ